ARASLDGTAVDVYTRVATTPAEAGTRRWAARLGRTHPARVAPCDEVRVRRLRVADEAASVAARRLLGPQRWRDVNRVLHRRFQRTVARRLLTDPVDVVVGFDTASSTLFAALQERAPGVIRVLEATIAAPWALLPALDRAAERHPRWRTTIDVSRH